MNGIKADFVLQIETKQGQQEKQNFNSKEDATKYAEQIKENCKKMQLYARYTILQSIDF